MNVMYIFIGSILFLQSKNFQVYFSPNQINFNQIYMPFNLPNDL